MIEMEGEYKEMRKQFVEDSLTIKVVDSFIHSELGEISLLKLGKYGYGVYSLEYGLVGFDDYYSAAYRYNAYAQDVNVDLCVPLDELDFDIVDKLF